MYSDEDLKKAPLGTRITFKNNEDVLVKTSEYTIEDENRRRYLSDYENLKSDFDGLGKIIKIEEPNYTTVYEVKDILDDKEKKYLSAVIRPFRNRVQTITKHGSLDEFISIDTKRDCVDLPYFAGGTMYKNMELDREYTLEELGL